MLHKHYVWDWHRAFGSSAQCD